MCLQQWVGFLPSPQIFTPAKGGILSGVSMHLRTRVVALQGCGLEALLLR